MRNLASIQRVNSLKEIEGADAIECATILGWHVVVKKGEFTVGDNVVYVEIDSILPEKPEFEFLRNKHFRIKTIRLRGQISQGICFPLSILPAGEYNVGDDVTEILGIEKWEPYSESEGTITFTAQHPFPEYIPKTDETRIQSIPDILEKYGDVPFYATEKLDGSSITVFVENGELRIASRNHIIPFSAEGNKYWTAVNRLNLNIENLKGVLQGELIGAGIQGNKYKIETPTIRWFNAYSIDRQEYLPLHMLQMLVDEVDSRGVKAIVPIVAEGIYLKYWTVDSLVNAVSTQVSALNPETPIEGWVLRPEFEFKDYDIRGLSNGRVSFKVINPQFLLKYNM